MKSNGKRGSPFVVVLVIIGVMLYFGLGGSSSGKGSPFFQGVLADLGAPDTGANISSLNAWAAHEGSTAANNPLDTTLGEPGATDFNSAGVRNYDSAAQGEAATAATIRSYPGILGALQAGTGVCGPGFISEFLTWSGFYSSVC